MYGRVYEGFLAPVLAFSRWFSSRPHNYHPRPPNIQAWSGTRRVTREPSSHVPGTETGTRRSSGSRPCLKKESLPRCFFATAVRRCGVVQTEFGLEVHMSARIPTRIHSRKRPSNGQLRRFRTIRNGVSCREGYVVNDQYTYDEIGVYILPFHPPPPPPRAQLRQSPTTTPWRRVEGPGTIGRRSGS